MTLREALEASIALEEQRIPHIPRIVVQPRLPSERLWELHAKTKARTATPDEVAEFEAMLAAREASWGVANDE